MYDTAIGGFLFDGSDGDIGGLTAEAAFPAAESSQMRINVVVIAIIAAAPGTLSGIGKIDISLGTNAFVQSIPDDLVGYVNSKRSGQRILRVEYKHRFRTALHTCANLFECILYTAVTVDLVAEEVGHYDRPGADIGNDLLQSRLIAFQHSVFMPGFSLPVRAADQVGRDPVQKIGTGFIQQTVMSRGCECVLDHVAGSGLAVCTGDDNDLHPL